MGIDIQFARSLIKDHPHIKGKKEAVMLGRQRWSVKKKGIRNLRFALSAANLPHEQTDFAGEDGYAEPFFKLLGVPDIKSMDFSPYQGCDFTQDLNEPPAYDLRDRFDLIVDGGTVEHVFNIPQALDTVFHMLREDGVFISINGMTGWAGHGFYQFSPELVWRYWLEARGCEVLRCMALPQNPAHKIRDVTDTGEMGRRFRGAGMEGRWYLYYAIRKTATANPAERITNAQQGDYAVRWSNAEKMKLAGE